jgi:hypothetical protein
MITSELQNELDSIRVTPESNSGLQPKRTMIIGEAGMNGPAKPKLVRRTRFEYFDDNAKRARKTCLRYFLTRAVEQILDSKR